VQLITIAAAKELIFGVTGDAESVKEEIKHWRNKETGGKGEHVVGVSNSGQVRHWTVGAAFGAALGGGKGEKTEEENPPPHTHTPPSHAAWAMEWWFGLPILILCVVPLFSQPVCFMDISIGGSPRGRIVMELFADKVREGSTA
jgi:hypothetical protein